MCLPIRSNRFFLVRLLGHFWGKGGDFFYRVHPGNFPDRRDISNTQALKRVNTNINLHNLSVSLSLPLIYTGARAQEHTHTHTYMHFYMQEYNEPMIVISHTQKHMHAYANTHIHKHRFKAFYCSFFFLLLHNVSIRAACFLMYSMIFFPLYIISNN